MGKRMFGREEIKFSLDEAVRQTYTTAKLLEMRSVDGVGIDEVHTLTEQSLVKRKDAGLIEMQTCVYQVVGWG